MKKQRPRQHVAETESEKILDQHIPSDWVKRRLTPDYGLDFEIEIFEAGHATGQRVWVQLKSVERLSPKRTPMRVPILAPSVSESKVKMNVVGSREISCLAFRMATSQLDYLVACPFPTLLLLADLADREVYWFPLRDWVDFDLARRNPWWRDKCTVTLHIPTANSLAREKAQGYRGLRWYALEPFRLHALATLQRKVADFWLRHAADQWSFGVGSILFGPSLVPGDKYFKYTLWDASRLVSLAMGLEVLYGQAGIDSWRDTKQKLQEALAAAQEALRIVGDRQFMPHEMGTLWGKLHSTIQDLHVQSSWYEVLRQQFIPSPWFGTDRFSQSERP
jgi:hypothetical protein